jgi:predicted acyl esterase
VTDELQYEVTETKNVLIPMRDGVDLAANLLLPGGAGPVPAIIVYFPYLKDGPHGRGEVQDWQRHFASRGYACLTIDMRGTGASGGDAPPPFSASEKQDAVDFLAWIADQSWCNGTTGMWGISYSGSSALAAASLQPPSLKAIIPLHGTANEFIGFLRPHGCRPAWWTEASWGPMMVLLSLLPPLHRDADRRWARVWHERLETLEPWPFTWHTTPFDDYMAWMTDASAVRAATYAVSAWHDYYPQATLDYFNAIPSAKRVLIGPWKHEFPDVAVRGSIDHRGEMDRWWDRWLKDVANGADDAPPVMIWRQGEDVWGYEHEWPPAESESQRWYAAPEGALTGTAPDEDATDVYRVDPTVGLHLLPWDPQAPVVTTAYDRSADDHRSLTYTSEPLDEALAIRGAPEAVIHLASAVPEFPLSAWLCDVAPSGHSSLICQGWINVPPTPAGDRQVRELRVPLYSTSYLLPAGHRLRLGMAGADFPLLWPSPYDITLEVERSPARPTGVVLPVVAAERANRPGPAFAEPATLQSGQQSVARSENRIVRELDGRLAAFHQLDESKTTLDDGVLTMRLANTSTTSSGRSAETILSAHVEAVLETAGESLMVTVDALQTNERYVFDARIEMNGALYFQRVWELPLARF